jgi:hypothetical protein
MWADVNCVEMKDSNNGHICNGDAQVRLENCNQ